jgi:hypothetical protein
MGYDLWFNTGYECRFSIENEPSFIKTYGGKMDIVECGLQEMKWTRMNDLQTITVRLRVLRETLGFKNFDVFKYSYDVEGTRMFGEELFEWATRDLEKEYAMGYLLYHQLMYKSELTCVID